MIPRFPMLIVLAACFTVSPLLAQEDKPVSSVDQELVDKLAKEMDSRFKDRKFSGAVLIAADGKVVFEKYAGYEDVEKEVKLTADSSFRLASVSKQFTAMAIMILKEEGKLDFDDEIQKHLPSLPYKGITIRHLLHHTGGLTSYMSELGKAGWDTEKTAFNKDLVDLYSKRKPKPMFEAGEKFEYSNTGYVLLASIVESASGQTPQQFYRTKMFQPTKMNHSCGFSTGKQFDIEHQVKGFAFLRRKNKRFRANDWNYLNGMIGDGGVYATAQDLLKWDQALYNETLVSNETLEEAFTPGVLNNGKSTGYGFGWLTIPYDAKRGKATGVTHSGAWVGFNTYINRDLENKTVSILLTNCSGNGYMEILESADKVQESLKKKSK